MMSASPSPTRMAALLVRKPFVMVEEAPGDRLQRLDEAMESLADDRLDEAESAIDALLSRHPKDADGLHFMGILRHKQGRSEEALELLRESLAAAPQSLGHWNNYGNVLLEQGRLEAATEAYGMSVKLAAVPGEACDAMHNLSVLERRLGHYADAERWARAALEVRPDSGAFWYTLSAVLMAQGRVPEALLANSKAITLLPRHLQARDNVIRALLLLGEREQAAELYREWLAEEPGNPVVQHQLAACMGEAAPSRASDAYVERVFDSFASSFDAKLEKLDYRAPQLVVQMLAQHLPSAAQQFRIADLGCGTGLVGPLIKPWARHLAGCDLSVGMLRRAKERGGYDVLHKAELVYYLQTQPGAFDVLVSADTLCYFGKLEETMVAAHAALGPQGIFVFTVEALPESLHEPHRLQANGRYAHARSYVLGCAEAAGFALRRLEPVTLRMEAGKPVPGWLATLIRA
jgi:predicted TPR repeat methyltransferase